MKRIFSVLICFSIFCESVSWAKDMEKVVDPYREEKFSCAGKPDGKLQQNSSGYGKFRIRADLNFDGKEDLILTQDDGSGCGNGYCEVVIFIRQADNAYLKEEFGLHPLAANLQKIKQGEGRLTVFWHLSSSDGELASYRITSKSVAKMNSKIIHPSESAHDRKLYESLFGDSSRLRSEFARCKNGKLEWTDTW